MTEATNINFQININGVDYAAENVPADELLINYLYETACLTGTKLSCGIGQCGACKVVVQTAENEPWMPLLACYARLASINGLRIKTVEGLAAEEKLHILQEKFLENYSFQCGFSTPGFLMAGYALMDDLKRNPVYETQLDDRILQAVSGHICRCTGYVRYIAAIKEAILEENLVKEGAPASVSKPASTITFQIAKKSQNDPTYQYLVGYFDEPTGSVTFDDSLDLDTATGFVEIETKNIRTGEPVRDYNLYRFLFLGLDRIRFDLSSAAVIDKRFRIDSVLRGTAIPITVSGSLSYGPVKLPVTADLNLSLLDESKLRIASRTSLSLSLNDLKLPLMDFAKEFYLDLNNSLEILIDCELQYRIKVGNKLSVSTKVL